MTLKENTLKYKAFGLNIESDFILKGLLPADGTADIAIVEDRIPKHLSMPSGQNAFVRDGDEAFAFQVKGIGKFHISQGNRIIVERDPKLDSDEYVLFILGTCFGVLLIQRGYVPIHGSALSMEGYNIIVTGMSGAGKSSLTAALNKRNYSFLSDDISALSMGDSGTPWIQPAFPMQKLWKDTAEKVFGSVDSLERISGIRDKYHVPMHSEFITTPRKLSAIFEITVSADESVSITEIKGSEKLHTILRNTYRVELIDVLNKGKDHFSKCSMISRQIPVFRIKRPQGRFSVEEQIAAILDAIGNVG